MKRIGLLIGFLAAMIVVLPSWTAQAPKKDPDKTDVKAKSDDKKAAEKKDEKKDPDKKDDKKDPDKKDEKKEPEKKIVPKKEKLVYGMVFTTKIMSFNGNNPREITVEKSEIDPKKVQDLQVWKNQQLQQQARTQFDMMRQTDPNSYASQLINFNRMKYDYGMEMAKRQNNIYTTKPLDLRAVDNVKVRSLAPPVEFDDQGFQKKWTKKELDARRDKTGLPGFAVELDALKQGQYVEIYMAKVAAPKAPTKKKNPDDELVPTSDRPEFVMIVIKSEPK